MGLESQLKASTWLGFREEDQPVVFPLFGVWWSFLQSHGGALIYGCVSLCICQGMMPFWLGRPCGFWLGRSSSRWSPLSLGPPWQTEQIEVMMTSSLVRYCKRNGDLLWGTVDHGAGWLDGWKGSLADFYSLASRANSYSLLMYFACSLQSVVQWRDFAAVVSLRASE